MFRIGKTAVTSPFRWPFRRISESEASAGTSQTQTSDRAAIGVLSRALLEAAASLELDAQDFRNGLATPIKAQRAHFAGKAARQVLEDLGITRRPAAAAASRAKV